MGEDSPSARYAPPDDEPRETVATGFAALDELARDKKRAGFFVVQAEHALFEALCRHVERRARAEGRFFVSARGSHWDDGWREIAVRLGIVEPDPARAAQSVAAIVGEGVALVERDTTHWGQAFAFEVSRSASNRSKGLFLSFSSTLDPPPNTKRLEVGSTLCRADVRAWTEALLNDETYGPPAYLDRVDTLDAWWSIARTIPVDARRTPIAPSPDAACLLRRCVLAGRALMPAEIMALGSMEAYEALSSSGLLSRAGDGRFVATSRAPMPVHETDRSVVADLLVSLDDPWAQIRAAELYAAGGCGDEAERAAVRALRSTPASARTDMWDRWSAAMRGLSAEKAVERLLRSAELALSLGHPKRAVDLARTAAAQAGERTDVMLMIGRSALARGDLTTADLALSRVLESESRPEERGRALVAMAEAQYLRGAFESARSFAQSALSSTDDASVQHGARNALGKLLLAAGSWHEAERHFDALAGDATCSGDLVSELRARINRGVSLLCGGHREDARTVLSEVLADADRASQAMAISFAVSNLALIAILEQDYAEAVRLTERAVAARRQVGDRNGMSHAITNLAELQVALGALDDAEQTIAFGKDVCGGDAYDTQTPHFASVEARIHFCRGDLLTASVDNTRAIQTATAFNYGTHLASCHVLDARIELERGDVVRAREALALARAQPMTNDTKAEVQLVETACLRAAGEAFEDSALVARARAIDASNREHERGACVLLVHAAKNRGDGAAAIAYLDAACGIRDRVAGRLPEPMRGVFLARKELLELRALERELRGDGEHSAPSSRASTSSNRTRSPTPADALRARLIGRDASMQALNAAIAKIGPSDATVLIAGESGTGKELVAEALHEASARRTSPLVKVNCAALVETLFLAELFGHERGAFTGAVGRRRGRFELAHGGTLFLDEIGDISPASQVALLRVLQDKTFERVGGTTLIRVDVRIVCATHRDLRGMVGSGQFRHDLYYRLAGVVLEVPPLRKRTADLPLLVTELLARIAREQHADPKRISKEALALLSRYRWPGNVRELENVLRAATVFTEGREIGVEVLQKHGTLLATSASDVDATSKHGVVLGADAVLPQLENLVPVQNGNSLAEIKRRIERDCIERALRDAGGNITRAAKLLGMKRPRLSQLVKAHRLGSWGEREG